MGYSSIATSIRNKNKTVTESVNAISDISFSSNWKGSAYESLTSKIEELLEKIKKEQENVLKYAEGLDKLQKYKDNKKTISNYKSKLASYPTTAKYKNIRSQYSNAISNGEKNNASLRREIVNIMSSFGAISSESITIDFGAMTNGNLNYVIDVHELLNIYKSGKLTKLPDGASLYKYVPEEQVLQMLSNIQTQYSGREAAVNSALLMLSLAAQNNVKLDYEHKGTKGQEPYVPTKEVASGVDCNPFASWVVDKGTKNGFQWRPVGCFKEVGTTIPQSSWNQAQPGDVFVSDGHVGVIIENDPATSTFICAEASGSNAGIILQTRTYSSLKKNQYQIRDMTNVYNGTENTNRAAFNPYVNWETYQRKP